MKRILFILAAAAMILPLSSSSCKKQDNPTEDVVMEPAKTADVAKVVSFELVSGATPRYISKEGKFFLSSSLKTAVTSFAVARSSPQAALLKLKAVLK